VSTVLTSCLDIPCLELEHLRVELQERRKFSLIFNCFMLARSLLTQTISQTIWDAGDTTDAYP
jgi:hypothetical protein